MKNIDEWSVRYLKSIFAEGLFDTHIGVHLGKVVGVCFGIVFIIIYIIIRFRVWPPHPGRSGHTTATTRSGSVGASDGVREARADDLSVVHADNVGITGIHHS